MKLNDLLSHTRYCRVLVQHQRTHFSQWVDVQDSCRDDLFVCEVTARVSKDGIPFLFVLADDRSYV